MEEEEFSQLVKSALRKEQKAQTRLINYFWEDVFRFIMSKVSDELVADELTVSVFSKVLSKLDLYDEKFRFKTWVLAVAQNTVIDFWRKKQRREEETFIEDLQGIGNEYAKSPEEIMISEQGLQKIITIISSMNMNYRKIIELRFYEERSIREIAEELNISIPNAKIRIMRAKNVLIKLLKNNNIEDE